MLLTQPILKSFVKGDIFINNLDFCLLELFAELFVGLFLDNIYDKLAYFACFNLLVN